MNHEHEMQLRRYTEEFDALITPLDIDAVLQTNEVRDLAPPVQTGRRRWPIWTVPVLVGLVVVLLVGGVPWLLSSLDGADVVDSVAVPTTVGDVEPAPTPAPAPTAPPTTPPSPTTTPLGSTMMFPVWTNVSGPEGALSVGGRGVLTTDGDGFIFCGPNWFATSTNGVDWERTDLRTAFSQGNSCVVWDGVVASTSGGGATGVEGQPIVANPSFVEVSQPNGDVSRFRIDGNITDIAVGGQGILISTYDNSLDHDIILGSISEDELGSSWVEDGILYGKFTDGTTRSVDLAAIGIDPDDLDKTYWWFSENGVEWSQIPVDITFEVWGMVGTADGFYAAGDSKAWFSPDGRSWEEIGSVNSEGSLTRTGGRPVWVTRNGFHFLDQDTGTEIQFNDLPENSQPWLIGEDSVLSMQFWNNEQEQAELKLAYAKYGQSFQPMTIPPEMAAASVFGAWMPSGGTVDNRYMLLLFEDDFVPTFWIMDIPTS